MTHDKLSLLFLLTATLGAPACSGDDGGSGAQSSSTTGGTASGGTSGTTAGPGGTNGTSAGSTGTSGSTGDPGMAELTVSFTGLPNLGSDYEYEGWLIVDGQPVTAGRFSVDDQGAASPSSFMVDAAAADGASLYVLTIEPVVGDAPEPSDTHVLAGDLQGGTADLTVAHGAALGSDFADAAGPYVLNTPSSAMMAQDYDQGIWWLDASGMEPVASLVLPQLPAGWVYEGWVVGPNGPVSTGTFTSPDGADSDGAGPDAGSDPAPPFPGQDFVMPPQVLTSGYAAVISVEPMPDNSPMPFAIKPLMDMDIEDVMPPMAQDMANIAADTLPTGSVTLTTP